MPVKHVLFCFVVDASNLAQETVNVTELEFTAQVCVIVKVDALTMMPISLVHNMLYICGLLETITVLCQCIRAC